MLCLDPRTFPVPSRGFPAWPPPFLPPSLVNCSASGMGTAHSVQQVVGAPSGSLTPTFALGKWSSWWPPGEKLSCGNKSDGEPQGPNPRGYSACQCQASTLSLVRPQ